MTLPDPDPAFRWTVEPWGHALRCQPLEAIAQHLFTTRQLALRSSKAGSVENTTTRKVPAAAHASEAGWAQATRSLGASLDELMRLQQVHGRTVRVLSRGAVPSSASAERPEADAVVSNEPGLVLAVQVADCVPILMADSRTGAAAAVHAGWRGTCARVSVAAIEAMTRAFATDPRDLTVAMGPSIGACCYDVGAELVDAFRAAGASDYQVGRWFSRDRGALVLDLAAANREQIEEAGVDRQRIFAAGLCTQTYADLFDSFRAAGDRVGRMAGLIRVP